MQKMGTLIFLIFLLPNIHIFLDHYSAFAQNSNTNLVTEGVASGDVTDHSVVIWSRSNRESQMNVEYDTDHNFSHPTLKITLADAAQDFTARIILEGLTANSLYYYRVWFSSQDEKGRPIFSNSTIGTFRTAPERTANESVNFVIGGDLGGQGYCRRIGLGYSIFSLIKDLSPDFFVFNGDQIYADSMCTKHGPAGSIVGWRNIEGNFLNVTSKYVDWTNLSQLHELYLRHWEYNRNDSHFKSLLQNVPLYSQLDDHEVIDNFGGNWQHLPGEWKNRSGYSNLVKTGMSMFFNFSPIYITEDDHKPIFRSFNWGKNLDLFLLDTRSYRSSNDMIDTSGNNKTLLGKEQLQWLKQGLLESQAIWKVISSPNSLTIPNCYNKEEGCDGWATDGSTNKTFVSERSELLRFIDDANIRNVVFAVTDVHFPATTLVSEDFNGDGDKILLYELISGPLSAVPLKTAKLDPTINVKFLYNESRIFSFSHIMVQEDPEDNSVHLIHEVRDGNGIIRPNSRLDFEPE